MAKRQPGKKIETWKYVDRADGIKIDVPVRMVTLPSQLYGGSAKVEFRVDLPDLEINDRDTDANKLRERVFEEIRAKRSTTWEDFLHVFAAGKFEGDKFAVPKDRGDVVWTNRPDEDDEPRYGAHKLVAALRIRVSTVRVGTMPDGAKVHRNEHCSHAMIGMPETGKVKDSFFDDRMDGVSALVPDTPEARLALAKVAEAIRQAHDTLKKYMHPDNVTASLEQFLRGSGLAGLPAPAQEEEE